MATIDLNGGKRIVDAPAGKTLLRALAAEKVFLPSACGGRGACGFCRAKVLEGDCGACTAAEERLLLPKEIESGTRLACQVVVGGPLKLRIADRTLLIREYTGVVERIAALAPDIRHFVIRLVAPDAMSFVPGQYLQLVTPPYAACTEEVCRSYSLASNPGDPGIIELIIRRMPGGIGTTYCFERLVEGEQVRVRGPYGTFRLSATAAPILMIAGGSGVAPIRSMLYQMQREGIARQTTFFFGANHENELCCFDDMRQFERVLPQFAYVPVVAMPRDGWQGETGLVTQAVDRRSGDLSGHEAYLCGGQGMIDATIAVLVKHGMPKQAIYYDKFRTDPAVVRDTLTIDPENAMDKYVCQVCGYVYDPAQGDAAGKLAAQTPFAQVPDAWKCPMCGAPKRMFRKKK